MPRSASGLWLSVFMMRSAEAGGGGAVGGPCVSWSPGLPLLWRLRVAEEQEDVGTGEKMEEQRSLTGQKAEPWGMKFTLFLSGHEKRGKPFDLRDLEVEEEVRLSLFSLSSSPVYTTDLVTSQLV